MTRILKAKLKKKILSKLTGYPKVRTVYLKSPYIPAGSVAFGHDWNGLTNVHTYVKYYYI